MLRNRALLPLIGYSPFGNSFGCIENFDQFDRGAAFTSKQGRDERRGAEELEFVPRSGPFLPCLLDAASMNYYAQCVS
jgi:hypothetical protein